MNAFHSNRTWESYRNILPEKNVPIGLSGIGLWRDNGGFAVELRVKDMAYKFNSIKIITPQNQHMFDLATSSQVNINSIFREKSYHSQNQKRRSNFDDCRQI